MEPTLAKELTPEPVAAPKAKKAKAAPAPAPEPEAVAEAPSPRRLSLKRLSLKRLSLKRRVEAIPEDAAPALKPRLPRSRDRGRGRPAERRTGQLSVTGSS